MREGDLRCSWRERSPCSRHSNLTSRKVHDNEKKTKQNTNDSLLTLLFLDQVFCHGLCGERQTHYEDDI